MLKFWRQFKLSRYARTENTLARYYSTQIHEGALFSERYQFAHEIIILMLSCGWGCIDGEVEIHDPQQLLDAIVFNPPVGAVEREAPPDEHGKKNLRENNYD